MAKTTTPNPRQKGRTAAILPRPAAITPTSSKKKVANLPYYRVFVLQSGQMKQFDTQAEAQEFMSEYDTLISSMETFTSRQKMQAFVKSGAVATPTKSPKALDTTIEEMSPEEKTTFNRIRTLMEQAKPQNTMNFDWKSTKKADKFVTTMSPKNAEKLDQWFLKTPFDRVIMNYFTECPSDLSYVNEFFQNIKLATARDPDKGPNDPKTSKSKTSDREFPCYVMYTVVTIPVEEFASATQEEEWIKGVLHASMNALRVAQRGPLFMEICRAAYSERMYKAMMSPTAYGGNFTTYIQQCRIKCHRMDNLNKSIVKDEANVIKMQLMESERATKKYPHDDLYSDQKELLEDRKPAPIQNRPSPCTTKNTTPTKKAAPTQKRPYARAAQNTTPTKKTKQGVVIKHEHTTNGNSVTRKNAHKKQTECDAVAVPASDTESENDG
jgi:hypothetical protein